MLNFSFDPQQGMAVLEPEGRLSQADFERVDAELKPYMQGHGASLGLVIHAKSFPGWDSMAGFFAHMKFVKEHHRQVRKIALSTDSALKPLATHLTPLFLHSQIKGFAYDELDQAKRWVMLA